MFVLIFSNISISALKNFVPDLVRIPAYVVIIATLVTLLQMFMQAYVPSLYKTLGIFIPLIVVNCAVVTRSLVYPFFIDTIQPGRFYLSELGVWIIIQLFIIPRIAKGWTIGSYLVGIEPKRRRKNDKQQPKDDANPEN